MAMHKSKSSLFTTLLLACPLALGSACGGPPPTEAQALATNAEVAKPITLAEALAIAQKRVPGGFAMDAELEMDGNDQDEEDAKDEKDEVEDKNEADGKTEKEPPVWEVSFFVAEKNHTVEVEVHALTGEVLEVEVDDDKDDAK